MTKKLAEKGPELLVFSTYGRGGASARVRLYDWLDHCGLTNAQRSDYLGTANNQFSALSQRLPEVLTAESKLRRLLRDLENQHIVISKQASPFSSGGIEQRLLERAAHSTYDFDDALLHDTAGWARRIWSKKTLWTRAVEAADVVIAGSTILANQASELSNNVVVIPSCIEPDRYVVKTDYELAEAPLGVWIGSPATEKFLLLLTEPLLSLNRERGLRIKVISAGDASLGALDSMIDRVAWSEEAFANDLSAGDFGLMPLDDTSFTRGKCSYKLLQYAASGLPVVGSPVGANDDALTKLGGFKATTGREWIESIEAILDMSARERARKGAVALGGVREHYSFGAWKDSWLRAVGM